MQAIKMSAGPSKTGDNTHIHGQLITLVSFRVINTIASSQQGPMPPPDLLLLSISISFPLFSSFNAGAFLLPRQTYNCYRWFLYRGLPCSQVSPVSRSAPVRRQDAPPFPLPL
jgi:hypothetical protein